MYLNLIARVLNSNVNFSSGTLRFSSDHVEESTSWTSKDKNRELLVTWVDYSMPKTCEAKKVKYYIPLIQEITKRDFVLMSADSFAQVQNSPYIKISIFCFLPCELSRMILT